MIRSAVLPGALPRIEFVDSFAGGKRPLNQLMVLSIGVTSLGMRTRRSAGLRGYQAWRQAAVAPKASQER